MCIRGHVHVKAQGWCGQSSSVALPSYSFEAGLFLSITSQFALEVEEIAGGASHPPDTCVGSGDANSGPLVCTQVL